MKKHINGFVGNRVLRLNVGFLLNAGPGHIHETELDIPAIRVADDVDLDYLKAGLRLSRTKEGILVQGRLYAGLEGECYRCLRPVQRTLVIDLEELFAYPASPECEFSIDEDAFLDLVPLVRAEIVIEEAHGVLCQPDCKGLCVECGENLNDGACQCEIETIDPRLAKLKALRDQLGR